MVQTKARSRNGNFASFKVWMLHGLIDWRWSQSVPRGTHLTCWGIPLTRESILWMHGVVDPVVTFRKLPFQEMASILWIPVAFGLFSLYLYYLSTHLPPMSENSKLNEWAQKLSKRKAEDLKFHEHIFLTSLLLVCRSALAFPSNMAELVNLADLLNTYKKDNAGYVTLLFSSAYVFKQTFAIPGSVFLVSFGWAENNVLHSKTSWE